ncbi:MAG: hypothetical protein AAGE89_04045 [Pseudomonadota bacterium]
MKLTCKLFLFLLLSIAAISRASAASDDFLAMLDDTIIEQRRTLAGASNGDGFEPQSPRDITALHGENRLAFGHAPDFMRMSLCNIHFHFTLLHDERTD